MVKIIDKPTSYREYYKSFHLEYEKKCDDTQKDIDHLTTITKGLKDKIEEKYDFFCDTCHIDLHMYEEYNSMKYITGFFNNEVKILFSKYSNKYDIKVFILILCRYANSLEKIYNKTKDLEKYRKCRNITLKEYHSLLERYFTEVHKYLILDGNGYQLSPTIGTICFSRCKLVNARPKIDFNATNKNKKKLIAAGEHLFDKDEAEFCKQNDIEYNGKDFRIFLDKQYAYEMPLLFPKFPNGTNCKFYISDTRKREIRGKTNAQLIEECNRDKNKIILLPVDIKTKLNMCLEVDKMLYSKFIRNENQKPIATTKAYR